MLSYTATGVILLVGSLTSSVIQPSSATSRTVRKSPAPAWVPLRGLGFSCSPFHEFYPCVALVILSGLGIASYHPEGFRTAHFFTGEKKSPDVHFLRRGKPGLCHRPASGPFCGSDLRLEFLPSWSPRSDLVAVISRSGTRSPSPFRRAIRGGR